VARPGLTRRSTGTRRRVRRFQPRGAAGPVNLNVRHTGEKSLEPKAEDIEKAFAAFDDGIRPARYRPSRHWYVLNKIGKPYPAKAIWALATNIRQFNTRDARLGLSNLEYSLIDIRNIRIESTFDDEVEKSKSDTPNNRRLRLKTAPKKPNTTYIIVKTYQRNPDVVAEVLYMAKGKCDKCKKPAPFAKKKDNSPYLEVHHKVPLADGGEDTVENAVALCPNCHRELHFGQ
jgi:5-methylcytosine-specific restriction protein A